jgi:hypothetical protein
MRRDSGSLCCAAFLLGSTSSTACPETYGQVVTAAACELAAGSAGLKYGGIGAYSSYPYGCYWHTITGSVYCNSNPAGAANVFAQPLCTGAAPFLHAGPSSAALTSAPAFTWPVARTHARTHTQRIHSRTRKHTQALKRTHTDAHT